MKRVLICANPDLNYIDGSSIWSQTIALAMSATGRAQVDFLAKSLPERDELYAPLKAAKELTIIDGTYKAWWQGNSRRRLTLPMMADLAVRLHQRNPYDVIIVRGFDIAKSLLSKPEVLARCWLYLTDIPQAIEEYSDKMRQDMQRLANGTDRLLCQAEGFKRLWLSLVPGLPEEKIKLYTPVIPDLPSQLTPIHERPVHAIYAGKFKGDWMTLEMAENWSDVHIQVPGSQLIMIGDKIHDEPERPNYKQQMQGALENTTGVIWSGAQSREFVQVALQKTRVGLSWRCESMNDTVEYSTKILEYGGAGCAAIINRNALHESLLGKDYPLFANSEQEFKRQLTKALTDDEITQFAADRLRNLAEKHTFTYRVNEIKKWLDAVPERRSMTNAKIKKIKVLVAGHDLKFFTLLQKKLESTGLFEFLIDQWKGHNEHDEQKSLDLLGQADVIFCEWCLGNLNWYSHNKLSHQRLVGRFHLQEKDLHYLGEANWDAIDNISYVSEYIRREGQKAFNFPFEKTLVIGNLLDEEKFTPKKKTADAQFTLGIIGVAPARKRLDRALGLLELLLEKDRRYCLRIKGINPLDYVWLLKREDERAYYQSIYKRINSNPKLRHKVIFDPPGDDVNEWLTMVGFILSPSDFESFHLAIGEGMLTGAVPVIWHWEGADEIWPREFVVNSTGEAAQLVFQYTNAKDNNIILPEELLSHKVVAAWTDMLQGLCLAEADLVKIKKNVKGKLDQGYFKSKSKKALRNLKNALSGSLNLNGFGEYVNQVFLPDFDWKDAQQDRNWWWQVQALPFLKWYTESWDIMSESERETLLLFCVDSLKQWFDVAGKYTPLLWHDHATAFRIRNLTNWLSLLLVRDQESLLVPEFVEEVLNSIQKHIEFLLEENNYTKYTNHGFDQSLILYNLCLIWPDFCDKRNLKSIAKERLIDEIEFAFTPQGVHKENSPGYQKFMLTRLEEVMELRLLGDTVLYDRVEGLHDKAREFLNVITLPNGLLPMVGDTRGGDAGIKHRVPDGIVFYDYSESGYFIAEGKTEKGKEIHLIFKCGHLSSYHRHDDDLSIHLYYDGEVVLGDGGLGCYNEKDERRIALRSAKSHNTVYPEKEVATRGVEELMQEPVMKVDGSVIAGVSYCYGITLQREIDLTEISQGKIKITDTVESAISDTGFIANFFAPTAKLEVGAQKFILTTKNGNDLSVNLGTLNDAPVTFGENGNAYFSEKYHNFSGATRFGWFFTTKSFATELNAN